MRRSGWLMASMAGLVLGASCSLVFPSGEYVGGEGGGEPTSGPATSSASTGGGSTSVGGAGSGGAPPGDVAALVFLGFGNRDSPTGIPGSIETNIHDLIVGDLGADGTIAGWRHVNPPPLSGSLLLLPTETELVAFGLSNQVDNYERAVAMRAPLDASLEPGAWSVSSDPSTFSRGYVQPAFGPLGGYLVGGYEFVTVDGGSQGVYYDTVERVPVNLATGAVTPRVEDAPLTTQRRAVGTLVHDGYLYVIGGYRSGSGVPEVEFAPIGDDGSLGDFVLRPELPDLAGDGTHEPVTPALCAGEGAIFVVGGEVGGAPSDLVLSAPIDPSGATGDFQHVTALPTPLYETACLVFDGRLYVFGGEGVSTRSDRVLVIDILDGGLLGTAWDDEANAPLPFPRSDHAVALLPR